VEATSERPADYDGLIATIREVVHRVVPINATVAIASRGDEELLELGPRQGVHFPQDEQGKYVGYHPADSDHAIMLVEEMRDKGVEYFLLPNTAFWWLDYYEGLRRYLEGRYRVVEAGDACWIAHLVDRGDLAANTVATPGADRDFMVGATSHQHLTQPLREVMGNLLPAEARVAFLAVGSNGLEGLTGGQTWLLPSGAADESSIAIAALQRLDTSQVDYLVIPEPLFDWLEDHPEVTEHLSGKHRFVTRQEHICEIYELKPVPRAAAAPPMPEAAAPTPEEPASHEPPADEQVPAGSEERGAGRRSFGEILRGLFFPARRNGKQG
jgi:hypothetical protein